MPVTLIGLAGPSGSGKSELSRRLAAATGAPIVSLDSYYKDLAHVPLSVREKTNFDDPASLDDALILDDARRLAAGEPVDVPLYNFATHTRAPGVERVGPGSIVILEGLFTLYWTELRDLLATKVYVDLEDETCFARRKERDVRERGRSPESVDRQYAVTVRPMAEKHIWPTRRHADIIIRGDAVLAEAVETVLRRAKAPSTS